MSRGLTTGTANAVESTKVVPAFLFQLQFADNTYHFWSGLGTLVWNGFNWAGVGTLGKLSSVQESTSTEAIGVTLSLSGIDPGWLAESLGEINAASRGKVYLAFLDLSGIVIPDPICLYSGILDGPEIEAGTKEVTININLENQFIEMNRSRGGRLTDQDQRSRYPNDASLSFVSLNQDRNLIWKA